MRKPLFLPFGPLFWVGLVMVVLLGVAGWRGARHSTPSSSTPITVQTSAVAANPSSPMRAGPPWVYGHVDARFRIIEYADLECPYCQTYFPVLKNWIDANPSVNWQWHHLPLAMHEPAANWEARLAECAGEVDGRPGFWHAIEWVYQHTRSDGQGLPTGIAYPRTTAAMRACLGTQRPDRVIRQQTEEASRNHITATPTLRVLDRKTGRSIILHGPVEGDALLSALDWLAATPALQGQTPEMPADTVSDMPR